MQRTIKYFSIILLWTVLFCACTTSQPIGTTNENSSQNYCQTKGKVQITQNTTTKPLSTQGSWLMFRGDLMHQGNALPGGSKLTMAWAYCTQKSVFSSPIVQNGIVYIASTDMTITALNIQPPEILWQFQADSPFYGTPVISGETLFADALNGAIYALNIRSGHIQWQTRVQAIGAKLWSSPTVAGGLVIFGVASPLSENPRIAGQLIALDAVTGQQRWRTFTLTNGAPGGGVWSSPAIDPIRHVVYIGTGDPDDGVQAFNLSDGHLLWHWRSVVRDVSDTDVGAGPLLFSGKQGRLQVMVGGKDGSIYSLDAITGNVTWQMHIGSQIFGSPAYADGILYAIATKKKGTIFWALNADTGEVHWQTPIPQWTYSSPVISGKTIYLPVGNGFGPGPGGIYTLSAENGQVLQYTDLHNTASSSPAVLPSWLFVGMNNGNLYAFTRSIV